MIGKKNGKYDIVEYSEFPASMAAETLEDGSLKYTHGHILIFVVRADLLLDLAMGEKSQSNALYHKAHKKISHYDVETGTTIIPTSENGWKFELFIHGFLPHVEPGKLGVLTVDRDTEFAPVKNADGENQVLPDTPAYCR